MTATRNPTVTVAVHLVRTVGLGITPPDLSDHTDLFHGFVSLNFANVSLFVDGHGIDVLRTALDGAEQLINERAGAAAVAR